MRLGQLESPAFAAGDREMGATEASNFVRLCEMVESYASSKQARPRAYLHASIRRLAVFSNDEEMSVRTPERVAQALCSHRHLLCVRQVEVLEDWVERRRAARHDLESQVPQLEATAGPRFA
jgi:hypothetical protein